MKTTFEIQNLKCGGCANTITKKVSNLEGVTNFKVDNQKNTVSFNYENKTTLIKVKEILVSLGYPIVGDKNAIKTKAKSFVSCAMGRINS